MTTRTGPALTRAGALWTGAALLLSTCGAAALARAWAPRAPLAVVTPRARSGVWRPHFRAVEPVEFAAGVALGMGALALGLQISPGAARVRGGWLFDDRVRRVFRLRDPAFRARVADASDAVLAACITAPFAQAGAVTGALRGDPAAAAQSGLIAAEAMGFTYAVMWGFKTFFGRERPCVTALRDEGAGANPGALPPVPPVPPGSDSFISGHAAFAFAGASLLCVQAGRLGLYRRGHAGLVCGASVVAAAATAAARVVADRHYATDVIAGALLGLLAGFVLPSALYLRRPPRR